MEKNGMTLKLAFYHAQGLWRTPHRYLNLDDLICMSTLQNPSLQQIGQLDNRQIFHALHLLDSYKFYNVDQQFC